MSVFFCFGFCYSQVQCEFHISTAYFRYTSTATASLLFKLTMYKKKLPIESFHQRRRNQRKVNMRGRLCVGEEKKCTRFLLQFSLLANNWRSIGVVALMIDPAVV